MKMDILYFAREGREKSVETPTLALKDRVDWHHKNVTRVTCDRLPYVYNTVKTHHDDHARDYLFIYKLIRHAIAMITQCSAEPSAQQGYVLHSPL